jgi:hypothetical protein
METERQEKEKDFHLIVNTREHKWPRQTITGSEILALAGSPSDWVVNQLVPGPGEDPEIGPDQSVDLSPQAEPRGVKRFQTRRPKTNPGLSFVLPEDDQEYLRENSIIHELLAEQDGGAVRRGVRFPGFIFAGDLVTSSDGVLVPCNAVDLMVLIPDGYTTTPLDSFYTSPRLKRPDGGDPVAATGNTAMFGQTWQFWSRHLSREEWRPGIDNLRTFLSYIRGELKAG